MLYSCNKVVFLLEETSQSPGTGDRERLGAEWAVLPSTPTVAETGNALGRAGAALQVCSRKWPGSHQSRQASQGYWASCASALRIWTKAVHELTAVFLAVHSQPILQVRESYPEATVQANQKGVLGSRRGRIHRGHDFFSPD